MGSTTTVYGLYKPSSGETGWGTAVDANWDTIDAVLAAGIGANLTVSGTFQISGDISPAQITSNKNNYAPTGLSSASVLRLNSDASRNITGLTGGSDGRLILIFNVGSFPLVLKDQSSSSTDVNRFDFGGVDVTLTASQSAVIVYDSTSTRWRPWAAGAGGDVSAHVAAGDPHTQYVLNAGDTVAGDILVPTPANPTSIANKDYVDTTVAAVDPPADVTVFPCFIQYSAGWANRSTVTSDTSQMVIWKGPDASPPSIGGSGAVNNVDVFLAEAP